MKQQVQKATNGKVFNVVKVVKIPDAGKAFRGMVFTFNGNTTMKLFYGLDTGNKLFWSVNGNVQQTNKGDFFKWLNKFEGADVKKIAGYTKLMKSIASAASEKANNVSMAPTDGRETAGGVPLFEIGELMAMKPYQLAAIKKQVVKALTKATEGSPDAELLSDYSDYISRVLAGDDGMPGNEAHSGALMTDGVKEGSEEPASISIIQLNEPLLRTQYEARTVKQLRVTARDQGIKGYSSMLKPALIAALMNVRMPF